MKYILVALLVFQSCTDGDIGPEGTLREYVNYRFGKNQNKEKLLEKTTGELFQDLSNLSEEALNALVNSEKYQRGSLKINLKKCSQNRCHITYTLKIVKKKDKRQDFEIEVKKIAQIDREGKIWKISKISELKSYFSTDKSIDVKTPGETRNPFKAK